MDPSGTPLEHGAPALSGDFDDFSLTELFELLAGTAMTGTLSFGEPVAATLWIRDGELTYGTSPGSMPPRDLLERRGITTGAEFDEAVAATDEGDALHETLRDRFDIDPAAVAAVAREQIVTTVFEIAVVGADSFAFHPGPADPLGGVVAMGHADVLREADHRRDEWRRIAELIPSTAIIPALSPTIPDDRSRITVTADQWQILAQLDGRRSAADMIENLGQSAFEVCGVLYDLLATGTARVVGTASDEDDP